MKLSEVMDRFPATMRWLGTRADMVLYRESVEEIRKPGSGRQVSYTFDQIRRVVERRALRGALGLESFGVPYPNLGSEWQLDGTVKVQLHDDGYAVVRIPDDVFVEMVVQATLYVRQLHAGATPSGSEVTQ